MTCNNAQKSVRQQIKDITQSRIQEDQMYEQEQLLHVSRNLRQQKNQIKQFSTTKQYLASQEATQNYEQAKNLKQQIKQNDQDHIQSLKQKKIAHFREANIKKQQLQQQNRDRFNHLCAEHNTEQYNLVNENRKLKTAHAHRQKENKEVITGNFSNAMLQCEYNKQKYLILARYQVLNQFQQHSQNNKHSQKENDKNRYTNLRQLVQYKTQNLEKSLTSTLNQQSNHK